MERRPRQHRDHVEGRGISNSVPKAAGASRSVEPCTNPGRTLESAPSGPRCPCRAMDLRTAPPRLQRPATTRPTKTRNYHLTPETHDAETARHTRKLLVQAGKHSSRRLELGNGRTQLHQVHALAKLVRTANSDPDGRHEMGTPYGEGRLRRSWPGAFMRLDAAKRYPADRPKEARPLNAALARDDATPIYTLSEDSGNRSVKKTTLSRTTDIRTPAT